MLTDDDLVRELEAGFRSESAGLRYAGEVPTPRRRSGVPWTAVPIAAATAAVLVLPQLGGPDAVTATPRPPAATGSATPDGPVTRAGNPSQDSQPKLVTDTIELAGFAFRYQHAPGTPVPEVFIALGSTPPEDATPVTGLDTAAAAWVTKAWVGTDPATGSAAVWVQSPGDGVGADVMFWSPDLTTEEMEQMLRTGATAEEMG